VINIEEEASIYIKPRWIYMILPEESIYNCCCIYWFIIHRSLKLNMRSSAIFVALATSIPQLASAHGFVSGVKVNGVWTAASDPVWYYYPAGTSPATAGWDSLNQDLGFVAPDKFGTSDIACHKSATVGKNFVNVKAGDTITFYWNSWADSHKGPFINYIAPYGSMSCLSLHCNSSAN
jgi:hypothetical protein